MPIVFEVAGSTVHSVEGAAFRIRQPLDILARAFEAEAESLAARWR